MSFPTQRRRRPEKSAKYEYHVPKPRVSNIGKPHQVHMALFMQDAGEVGQRCATYLANENDEQWGAWMPRLFPLPEDD